MRKIVNNMNEASVENEIQNMKGCVIRSADERTYWCMIGK
jgi:hypothetical protein